MSSDVDAMLLAEIISIHPDICADVMVFKTVSGSIH
jgi:hypothetical protein